MAALRCEPSEVSKGKRREGDNISGHNHESTRNNKNNKAADEADTERCRELVQRRQQGGAVADDEARRFGNSRVVPLPSSSSNYGYDAGEQDSSSSDDEADEEAEEEADEATSLLRAEDRRLGNEKNRNIVKNRQAQARKWHQLYQQGASSERNVAGPSSQQQDMVAPSPSPSPLSRGRRLSYGSEVTRTSSTDREELDHEFPIELRNRSNSAATSSRPDAITELVFSRGMPYEASVPGGTQPHPLPIQRDEPQGNDAVGANSRSYPWDGEEQTDAHDGEARKAASIISHAGESAPETGAKVPDQVSQQEGADQQPHEPPRGRWFHSSFFDLFQFCERLDYLILAVGIVFAVASGIPLPLIGVLFGQLIDGFNKADCAGGVGRPLEPEQREIFLSQVQHKVVLVLAAASANFVFIYIYTCCWSCFGERLVRKLRQRYIRALLRQDMTYFDQLQPGEVGSRLSTDLLTIQTGTNEKCGIFIGSLSYFVTSFVIAFVKLPTLAAQLLALLPAFGAIAIVSGKYLSEATTTASGHLAHANSLATEALSNLPSVQALGASGKLCYIYEKHLELARKAGTRRAIIAAVQMGSLFFVGYSANALAFFSGSRIISQQSDSTTSTVGNVYTVIFLLLDASFIVGQITPYLQTFQSAGGAGQHILRIINRSSPIDATDLVNGLKPESSALKMLGFSFRNVNFAYPMRPDVVVAKDLSLDIEPGARVGICGTSGSGKSTVVALCQRFYDPNSGSIALDGHDLRDYNVRWLRSQIGVVGQEPTLFDADVMQTIAHGLTGSPAHEHLTGALEMLSDGRLYELLDGGQADAVENEAIMKQWREIEYLCQEAARMANAHEFIQNLPEQYRTGLGDAGGRLSGGQKQRLALARAIVKQPRILILDEATAALDSISEQLVQMAIDKVSAGRTTITVAHRLSTLRNCDKIVVMSKGSVIESGSHDQLMESKGRYFTLAMAQNSATTPSTATPMSMSDGTLDDDSEFGKKMIIPDESGDTSHSGAVVKCKAAEADVSQSRPGVFRRLVVMLSPYWLFVIVGFATSTVIGSSYSGEAVIFGHTIDALSLCGGPERVRSKGEFFALLFFVLAIIQVIAYSLNGASFGYVSERFVFTIRRTAFKALLRQHISWFQEEGRSAGATVSSLSSDTASLAGLTGTVIGTIFSVFVNLLVGFTLAHIVAWRIALAIAAAVPILILSGYLRLHVLAALQRRHETAFSACNALAIEAVSGIKTVAALGREQDIMHLLDYRLQKPYTDGIRQIFFGNFFLALSLSISYFVYGFAYWWGSRNVADGYYTQVDFFIVLPALLFSAQASGQLLAFSPDISKAHVSASNIFRLLDDCPPKLSADEYALASKSNVQGAGHNDDAPTSANGRNPVPATKPLSLEFRNVWFSYPTRRLAPALRDLSFKVSPGQYVAFAGSSGSGKSTVMSLIERFYEPDSGCILVDNEADRPAALVREDIAWVQQEPILFYGTIRFNVSLGARPKPRSDGGADEEEDCWVEDPDWERYVSDEEIIEACKAANIHDTIVGLPNGYDTLVGAKGSQLSGGQRARLAFARALLRKPRLLLLDESTAALDAESEQIFERTVDKIRKEGKTTIIAIAHRIRTIQSADRILFFSKGQIISSGKHEELMAINADYRAMVVHQQLPV
ncbi:hypothetical protein A4X09_0g827 [Tilletia walkeri]|uniref:Leptomycin B resistance protein pmd1 n=1 Tax=Tilletia walkeri TaxID=117179 RepID=A0A8X7NEM6_9BASI|nr:hypothetical protein A4X09_0g827 [Tilletia walkeri]